MSKTIQLINLLVRLAFLAILIIIAMTTIPRQEIPMMTRLIVATVVVIIYSVIDLFGRAIKDRAYELICGKSSDDASLDLDL